MQFLFRPIDISSLVFFRIIFGILGFLDVIGIWWHYHLQQKAFEPDHFQFYYYGFEWVQPLPEPLMSFLLISLAFAALFIALGKWYRWASILFAIGFTYTFLLEKAHYLNHGYLFCWISFVMIFLPANRALSLDILKKTSLKQTVIPAWCLIILPAFMAIVYFFGGIAKINPDWLQAMPLKLWLSGKKDFFLIGPLLKQEWFAYFMSYGGLIFDLFIVLFLFIRQTRGLAFIAVLFFHFLNTLIFNIGIFPTLSIALSALFFPPNFPKQVWIWLVGKIPGLKKLQIWWGSKEQKAKNIGHSVGLWQEQLKWRLPILISLLIIFTIHICLPLRHHFYEGNVAWTEEGHRYAWRMMLRSKYGYGHFLIVDPSTEEEIKVMPNEFLTKRQNNKLFTHPDMILQFAHFLKRQYKKEGQDVEVYADIKVRLNGMPSQRFIDPGVDLAAQEWSFFESSTWIIPLEK